MLEPKLTLEEFVLTLEKAIEIIGHIASASKMPCQTYSLPAKECNVGSKLREIPGSVCSKCYAMRGNFSRTNVQRVMYNRLKSLTNPLWVSAMVLVLKLTEFSGFFRWHSSGDLQDLGHLIKIAEVARRLPKIKFWLPTREIGILNAYKAAGFEFPPNLVVRFTASMIEARPPNDLMKRLGIQGAAVSKQLDKVTCPSHNQGNQCLDCRKCWDKRNKVITYKYH